MPGLLLVEDDDAIAVPLARALERGGYEVRREARAAAVPAAIAEQEPELVVLDLGLPDGDGIELCRQIRAGDPGLGILIVTARAEEMDAVVGLDAGADDYVVKPFRLAELLARIRVRLRDARPAEVAAQDVRLDLTARRAFRGGNELALSHKEFDLLALLVRHAGAAVTREELMDHVWGQDWFGPTKTLDVHIAWLRRKLGDDVSHPRYLSTLRGVGYRFERTDPNRGEAPATTTVLG